MSKMMENFKQSSSSCKRIKIIARKEFSDAVISKRLWIIIVVLLTYYVAMMAFTNLMWVQVPGEARPSSIIVVFSNAGSSVAFMAPFLGIAFGYDALSRERESGTLRILLSRPVYRDDVVNGKILSSFAVISITLFTATFLTVSITIFLQGISISLDEVVRLILFCIFSLIYAFAYYSISLFISAFSSKSGHSLVISVVVWIFLNWILPIISYFIAFFTVGMPTFTYENVTYVENNATYYYTTSSFDYESWQNKLNEITGTIQFFSVYQHYSNIISKLIPQYFQYEREALDVAKLFSQYPLSIAVLILYPIIFIILSYTVFARREEK